ncbi:hypothetical protein Tco_1405474 [Tanacetum coccineum]
MAEPNNYITATQKNFVSNDNEGRMVEKCIVKIQGKFLEKIRNDAFNGNKGENAYEHINKFLDVVGPIKINGFTQDRLRLSIFPVSLTGAAYEWFTKKYIEEEEDPNETDNALEIFMIEGNLFDFETPLCEAFNEFNCLLKIDIDLFTYDIQEIKTYDEYEQELNNDEAKGTDEPWWYDELADGKLKDETLAFKAKIEGSRGDATPGVIKFCRWLKCCFKNFHELEYEVLVKLQECWWKVNAHEITLFTHYEASNVSCTQENQKDDPIPEPSNCKVRRFEMTKYSFNNDEEYITIKESEYLNHSKDILDAYQELLRLINDGWVVTTPDKIRRKKEQYGDLAETMIWYMLKKTCVELIRAF